MTYLAIDESGATSLAAALQRVAMQVDPIQALIAEGQVQADFPLDVALQLDGVHSELREAAAIAIGAARRVREYQLAAARVASWAMPMVRPPARAPSQGIERVPTQIISAPTGWHGSLATPWDLTRQDASHNSFQVPGAIEGLAVNGVRTFELDIHRGAPTDFTPDSAADSFVSPVLPVIQDHFDHAGGRNDDWRVYHFSGDSHSAYDYLSDGLGAVASLDTREPLTVFIDNKDPFADTHSVAQLDRLLEESLGPRLFTPADLLARDSGATTMQQAIAAAGWPTVQELQGRVMVVITDNTDGVAGLSRNAFAAPEPNIGVDHHGSIHLPDPNVVFYNANAAHIRADEIAAVRAGGNLIRTYNNPLCVPSSPVVGGLEGPNYRAADLGGTDPAGSSACGTPGPWPPEGTPVPLVGQQN